jgi:membrane protease YdiL (CAAX protease family)
MAEASAIVGSVAALPILLAWQIARGRCERLLPAWKPWRVPWGGFEVVVLFLLLMFVVPQVVSFGVSSSGFFQALYGPHFTSLLTPASHTFPEGAAAVAGAPLAAALDARAETDAVLRVIWSGIFALPLQLSVLVLLTRSLYPGWRPPRPASFASRVALGGIAALLLSLLVLTLNFAVNLLFNSLGWVPESHQLTRMSGRSALDSTAFLLQACVSAPIIEEIVFRGVILPWAMGCRKPQQGVPDVAAWLRPWVVAFLGVLLAWESSRNGAVIFAASLLAGLAAVRYLLPGKRRTACAIYASAALFAAVHSRVWPSPIPLFVLGLGLGYLAARTRGVLVPIIVHGLFNAVSVVFVLRSTS